MSIFFAFLLKLCVVNFICNCQIRDEKVINNYFGGLNLGRVSFCVQEMFVKHVLCFQKISVNFQPTSVVYLAFEYNVAVKFVVGIAGGSPSH